MTFEWGWQWADGERLLTVLSTAGTIRLSDPDARFAVAPQASPDATARRVLAELGLDVADLPDGEVTAMTSGLVEVAFRHPVDPGLGEVRLVIGSVGAVHTLYWRWPESVRASAYPLRDAVDVVEQLQSEEGLIAASAPTAPASHWTVTAVALESVTTSSTYLAAAYLIPAYRGAALGARRLKRSNMRSLCAPRYVYEGSARPGRR